ncbi:hypothetical protein LPB86_04870 [Pedobacter sp. MC2016-14]|uniref:hypothetical protein n=1 Tax=Pedobacter sp. MC2016-14 TaxID=2897327 RepID=UPI001E55D3CF|nr:hypothetical protein [Pedobacter sp. MC2016-14]MCD0487548.1 hypothetical protein [Pedobacter sp. MC2016-14]
MNKQNIDPKMDVSCADPKEDTAKKSGLDNWNDRLDQNLEPEAEGNTLADENAEDYSDKKGSGDQSDAN